MYTYKIESYNFTLRKAENPAGLKIGKEVPLGTSFALECI